MAFKALKGMVPNYLTELFSTSDNATYVYSLRSNSGKLYLDEPKPNFLKRSFSYRAAMSWVAYHIKSSIITTICLKNPSKVYKQCKAIIL